MQNLGTISEQNRAEGHEEDLKRSFLPIYLGPFDVTEVLGHGRLNRRLALPKSLIDKIKTDVFHIDLLKQAFYKETDFDISEDLPPPSLRSGQKGAPADLNADDEQEFFVERVEAWTEKIRNIAGPWYFVKYRGYDKKFNQWQHEENLTNCKELIQDFLKSNPRPTNLSRQRVNRQKDGMGEEPTRHSTRKPKKGVTAMSSVNFVGAAISIKMEYCFTLLV